MESITYRGQSYKVESTGNEKAPYLLHGPKGACLGMLRHITNHNFYYLVNMNTRTCKPMAGGFRMNDGQLREVA